MNKERKFTKEFIVNSRIAYAINDWIREKGDQIDKYHTYLDRICEIQCVVEKAKQKADEFMEEHKGKGVDF